MKNPFSKKEEKKVSAPAVSGEASTRAGKTFTGQVVSDKMKDTVVVLVERYVKHPKYEKFVKKNKKFKAHDAGNTKKIGDKVTIRETKPISKDKHFVIV